MTNRAADQRKAARVAGFLYLIIIITSLLSVFLVESKLVVPEDAAATFNNIMANELLFRIGAAYDLIMYASVVVLSVALYVILKTVNKNLALFGLSLRLGEAILGCLTALSSFIILLLINGKDFSLVFETEQLHVLVGLFLEVNYAVTSIVFIFLSLGSLVFCYLFFQSNYIPRILAAFGIFSFLLTIIGTFINILSPFSTWMLWGGVRRLFFLN